MNDPSNWPVSPEKIAYLAFAGYALRIIVPRLLELLFERFRKSEVDIEKAIHGVEVRMDADVRELGVAIAELRNKVDELKLDFREHQANMKNLIERLSTDELRLSKVEDGISSFVAIVSDVRETLRREIREVSEELAETPRGRRDD